MRQYFASAKTEELIESALGYINKWDTSIGGSGEEIGGMISVMARNIDAYYGHIFENVDSETALTFKGEQGEYVSMNVNTARSAMRQFLSIVTKSRSAFEVQADNTSSSSIGEAKLGKSIVEDTVVREKVDLKGDKMAEHAGLTGMGYMRASWNMSKGTQRGVDPDTGEVYTSGDIEITNPTFLDVIFDYNREDWDDLDWVICRVRRNKWDLAAQAPNLKSKIEKLESINNKLSLNMFEASEDDVWVYEFYHRETSAIPGGRLTVFASKDVVLFDDANPYGFIPIVCMKPEPIYGTGLGYPLFHSLLPAQEMRDVTISTIATNHSALGISNVLVPDGADITTKDINGLNFIYYNAMSGGKPESINFANTPAEIFRAVDMYKAEIIDLSGLNGALRGTPPPGMTSGIALAQLSANALEAAQPYSKAYNIAIETLMTYVIKIYQKFAKLPQIVPMMGKGKQYIAKQFIGDDIKNISKVTVKVSNVLAQTAAGRIQIGEMLLNAGLIQSPQKFVRLLDGSPIETLYEDEESDIGFMEEENEDLLEGLVLTALADDDHGAHYRTHRRITQNPELRRLAAQFDESNPEGNSEEITKAYQVIKNTLEHLSEHLGLAKNTDPFQLALALTGKIPQNQQPQQLPPGNPEQQ